MARPLQQGDIKKMRIIGALLLVAGVIIMAFGFDNLIRSANRHHSWLHAEGTVVRLKGRTSSGRHGSTWAPVFQFTTPNDGKLHTVTGRVASSPPAYSVGEKVRVLYSAEAPQDAIINSFFQLYFTPIFLIIFGIIWAGIGVLCRVSKSSTTAKTEDVSLTDPHLRQPASFRINGVDVAPLFRAIFRRKRQNTSQEVSPSQQTDNHDQI